MAKKIEKKPIEKKDPQKTPEGEKPLSLWDRVLMANLDVKILDMRALLK